MTMRSCRQRDKDFAKRLSNRCDYSFRLAHRNYVIDYNNNNDHINNPIAR